MVSSTVTDLTLVSDDEARQNLVYLSTRFWGQPLSGDELTTWLGSFKALAAATKTVMPPDTVLAPKQQVWGGICIAMMIDPRFFTY